MKHTSKNVVLSMFQHHELLGTLKDYYSATRSGSIEWMAGSVVDDEAAEPPPCVPQGKENTQYDLIFRFPQSFANHETCATYLPLPLSKSIAIHVLHVLSEYPRTHAPYTTLADVEMERRYWSSVAEGNERDLLRPVFIEPCLPVRFRLRQLTNGGFTPTEMRDVSGEPILVRPLEFNPVGGDDEEALLKSFFATGSKLRLVQKFTKQRRFPSQPGATTQQHDPDGLATLSPS